MKADDLPVGAHHELGAVLAPAGPVGAPPVDVVAGEARRRHRGVGEADLRRALPRRASVVRLRPVVHAALKEPHVGVEAAADRGLLPVAQAHVPLPDLHNDEDNHSNTECKPHPLCFCICNRYAGSLGVGRFHYIG